MKFKEWLLLKEDDIMSGMPPTAGPGAPLPPTGGAGALPMGGPPSMGAPGGDLMGGMGGGMGGMGGGIGGMGGGPITQNQLTKMKSVSAWDAIAKVLDGDDKNGGKKSGNLVNYRSPKGERLRISTSAD